MAEKKTNYLKLTPEEEAKVQRSRERSEALKLHIDREDLAMAEIAVYLGWEAVRDVKNDEIELETALELVRCAKELHKDRVYELAVAVRAGTTTVKGAFEKLMKPYVSQMRVE